MIDRIQKQIIISKEQHSQRLDSVLAQLIPEYSRTQISTWIKEGAILRNHKPCKPKDKILSGDLIELNIQLTQSEPQFNLCQPEDIPLDIVFEDEELLVLNKPAGLIVHPGAGNKDHTLIHALLHHHPCFAHVPRAGIIHRLDKETTGLLIVAKTLTAHTSLIRQMQARAIQRRYITLVQGHLISGGTIDTCFGRHPRNRLKMSVMEQGRQAVTHYAINKHYKDFTLLDVQLMTGRTHQIRVHLAYIHHPVVGDPLYGGRMRFPSYCDELLRLTLEGFKRQALHARFLSFCHPKTEEELTFEAPLPCDFKTLLDALETYDAFDEH